MPTMAPHRLQSIFALAVLNEKPGDFGSVVRDCTRAFVISGERQKKTNSIAEFHDID